MLLLMHFSNSFLEATMSRKMRFMMMRMSTMSLPEFVEMLFQKFHLSISTQQSLLLMMGAENLLDGLSE